MYRFPQRFLAVASATFLVTFLAATSAWAQRELKDIPDPDPELERASFIVADGFEVNLYAADPRIAKPIQMNFDAQGRLWIASSEVYPHIKPGQQATDKILVISDRNADGRADETTVFADGLLIPTGVIPGDGGAYVVNSTELLHLQDTDGDGSADRRRIVLSGFGTEDTHHLLHTLRWGPDGALYMNQSIYIHSHVETPYGVQRLNGGGIWRFRPETMELEVLCKGFVNPWGHDFDDWGQSFATDGAYTEGINYVFPGSVFVTSPGATRIVGGMNPGSPKHCGLEIIGGRHLPPEFAGSMVTNDFRAHRVCRFVVSEDGSSYASRQETELIKTSHVAFRPIDVKMGPDGAIYIADWYNPIIQHGEVDFRDPRRDHVHGRIWRITAKGRPTLKAPQIVGAPLDELLDLLAAPESWTRQFAKLELKTHNPIDAAGALRDWRAALDPADENYEHHRLEALWAGQCIGRVDLPLLNELLHSADHRVRAAALRVAVQQKRRLPNLPAILKTAIADEHPQVRLEAVCGLAQIPSLESAQVALQALARPIDRSLDFALWQTMRDLAPHWLPAAREGRFDFGGDVSRLTFALQAVEAAETAPTLLKLVQEKQVDAQRSGEVLSLVAGLGGPAELRSVLEYVVDNNSPLTAAVKARLLEDLANAAAVRRVRPDGDVAVVTNLLDDHDAALRAAALRAAGAWKIEGARQRTIALARGEEQLPAEVQHAAIAALADLGGPASVQTLEELAGSEAPFEIRRRAASALAALNVERASLQAVQLLADPPESADPNALIGDLLRRKGSAAALVAALNGKSLSPDAAKLALRAANGAAEPSQSLIEALRKSGGLEQAGWKLSPELLAELTAEVNQKGDPARGEAIYRRDALQCLKCHAIGGAGGRVGPDLISIGASAQVDYLIESLIEPNKKIKENFHSQLVLTDEGKVISGIPVRQSQTELVLRDADDKQVTIPLDAIEERRDGRSLMPDGAINELTREELVDLVRFLSELGKVGDYQIGKAQLARRWETLIWTDEAHRRLNRTSFDTAATDDPALTWQSAYSQVSGRLPIAGLPKFQPHRTIDPTSFVRCQIDVTTAGEIALSLDDPTGLLLWIDGKPTSISKEVRVELAEGVHTITLAANHQQRAAGLLLELIGVDGGAQAQWVSGK